MLFLPFLGCLSAAFWSWRFYSENLIAPWACLLHFTLAVLVLLLARLGRESGSRSAGFRYLWHAAFAGWFLLLNLAAAGNYISRSSWGDPLAAGQMWHLLKHERIVQETLREAVGIQSILLGLAALLGLFAAFRLYRRHAKQNFLTERRRPWGLATFGLAALTGTLGLLHPAAARQEPLIGFLGGASSVADLNGLDGHRRLAAELDRRTMAQYGGGSQRPRKNVVLILADSLRADHLPVYGYDRPTTPFLSELAKKGHLQKVEHAFSACSESYCGIAAALTGQPLYKISPQNTKIYELLAKVGYSNQMVLVGDHEVFAELGTFYGPLARRELPAEAQALAAGGDDQAIAKYLESLGKADGTPRFFFFFLLSTHALGQRFAERPFVPDNVLAIRPFWNHRNLRRLLLQIKRPPEYLTKVINHYDNGLVQGDLVVRQIFDGLKAKGYLDDALILLSGDHGDALGEHNHLGHTFRLYNEDIRVPLLAWDSHPDRVFAPGSHASHMDFVPTILDRLGLPIPAFLPGRSLYRPSEQHVSVHMTRRGQEPCAATLRSRGEERYKLITCRVGNTLVEELYDLVKDPQEQTNLATGPGRALHADLLDELRAPLDFFYGELVNSCDRFDCIDPKVR